MEQLKQHTFLFLESNAQSLIINLLSELKSGRLRTAAICEI